MKRIKIAQIGVGHDHARFTIETLKKRDDLFDLVGYVELQDEAEMKATAKGAYDDIKQLSLEEVFSIRDLQAVAIETEDCLLTKYARIFAERGLAVQMDKPGGQNGNEFDSLLDYMKKNNLVFHMGYMYRYNPAICALTEMIQRGELGDIINIDAEMNCLHPDFKRAWLKHYQGGMTNFLGCHLIDLVLRLQGVPSKIIPLNFSSGINGIKAEDGGMVAFQYPNGISIIKSFAFESGGFARRQIIVRGSKATVEINPTEYYIGETHGKMCTDMRIAKNEDGIDWNYRPKAMVFGPFDRYEEMFEEFAKIVNGEMQNPYSYEYEKQLHHILLASCGV
jgi:predicted dehydrogenase